MKSIKSKGQGKCAFKVNTINLEKTSCHKSHFKLVKTVIEVKFWFEHSFACHNVDFFRGHNFLSGLISLKSVKFSLYSLSSELLSHRILHSLLVDSRCEYINLAHDRAVSEGC